MATLTDVQKEVTRQLARDYSEQPLKDLAACVFFGLAEEAGEVAGLAKRVIRGFPKDFERTTSENFIEEMGDVLWYLAACCAVKGTSLEEIWEYNIKKLRERYGE